LVLDVVEEAREAVWIAGGICRTGLTVFLRVALLSQIATEWSRAAYTDWL
jgi:hypothetical protein